MQINTFDLATATPASIETEILFAVASTRARGFDFLILEVKGEAPQKTCDAAMKILKKIKSQRKIGLYILADACDGTSKEALYMRNKHPEVAKAYSEGATDKIIVKI